MTVGIRSEIWTPTKANRFSRFCSSMLPGQSFNAVSAGATEACCCGIIVQFSIAGSPITKARVSCTGCPSRENGRRSRTSLLNQHIFHDREKGLLKRVFVLQYCQNVDGAPADETAGDVIVFELQYPTLCYRFEMLFGQV